MNAMLIADHRAVLRDVGATPVAVSGAAPVDAWVRDRGVRRLPAEVAEYADERARYATVRVEAALLAAPPASGATVSFAGAEWQVRQVQPMGTAGAPALYTLHCVAGEVSRSRTWGRS
ncbi:hypothetical protein [Nitratidesulfovibrio sp. 1201_IL3209]|uniref:hypothetical protein n=1 Tax=Nitratidesulfovibrio sp. 1201_IL3209 TaxID=3084053 RepID=UPI002FD98162